MAPKGLAPMRTGIIPNRLVRASGKAMKYTNLSLPSGVEGGASSGQSIAAVKTAVTATVRGMSRYLRIPSVCLRGTQGASVSITIGYSWPTRNLWANRDLGPPISSGYPMFRYCGSKLCG